MRTPVIPFKPPPATSSRDDPAAVLEKAADHLAEARELVESLWAAEMGRPDDADRFPLRFRLANLTGRIQAAGRTAQEIAAAYTKPHPLRKPR